MIETKRVILICLAVAALLGGFSNTLEAAAPDLAYLDIAELQDRMDEGELTAVQLVSYFVQRIAEIDKAGPTLSSVIEINPDAFAIAAKLDAERATRGPRGPMHGIPVLLKANIDTGDRMDTTAGSLALQGHKAPDDAFHIEALRQSGAIILGKTNLSEWANFRSTSSSSGWSSVGGQTRNPHSTDRNPCGSSSGSAVAVAAGLTSVAVGTETNGSVVCPAGNNGIVGIKPTVGLVSRDGIIPIAHTQDTAGPMARSVSDAAVLLTAMATHDPADPAAAEHPGVRDYTSGLRADGLHDARIGVWRGYSGAGDNPAVSAIFEHAIEAIQSAGAEVVDPVELEIPDEASDAEYEVLLFEFKADLNQYLAAAGVDSGVDTLADLIEFNRQNEADVMPWFGQEIFEKAEAKGSLDDPAYLKALRDSHDQVSRLLSDLMEKHDLDALIAPTNGPAWSTDLVHGDRWNGFIGSSSPAAISGFPSVTLPMGQIHRLPIGISIIGLPYTEGKLISFAYALEQRLEAWSPPALRSSVESLVE